MAMPEWAIVVLVVYPLAQVPLVLYLARYFELDGEAPAPVPGRSYWADEAGSGTTDLPVTAKPGHCARCGSENDPLYTYCGTCLAQI